ncbi:MAG: dihydroorotase [Planctomycetota bacterium]
MSRLILQGGRLLDPSTGQDEVGDLRVEGDRIVAHGRLTPVSGEQVLDTTGLVITPGFVDLCVHLREPGFDDVETIRSGAQAALAGGFTAVAAMPDTEPPVDNVASATYLRFKGEKAGAARVYPVGALTRGREGTHLSEMAGMESAGVVAFSDEENMVQRAEVFLRALRYARMLHKPVLSRCEDLGLRGAGVANGGLMADLLGLPALAPGSEEIPVSRNLHLARMVGSPLHLLHLSSEESLNMVAEAKASGVQVTCSVTPQHLMFTEEAIHDYDPLYKYFPPLRRESDRQALIAGLHSGTVDAVSSAHAPRGEGEKNVEFVFAASGTGGLEVTFAVLYTQLVVKGHLDLERLIAALSTAPARILGVPGGTLQVGSPADLTCLSLKESWRIDPTRFLSRSSTTPFAGWEVQGRPLHVIVGGQVLYRDGKLVAN